MVSFDSRMQSTRHRRSIPPMGWNCNLFSFNNSESLANGQKKTGHPAKRGDVICPETQWIKVSA
jgi:hypothetical protein